VRLRRFDLVRVQATVSVSDELQVRPGVEGVVVYDEPDEYDRLFVYFSPHTSANIPTSALKRRRRRGGGPRLVSALALGFVVVLVLIALGLLRWTGEIQPIEILR
jgi:hypothetical protein